MKFFSEQEIVKDKSLQVTPISYFGQRETIIPDLFKLLGDRKYQCFYDPFAGSGSISFEAMQIQLAQHYVINDSFPILRYLWELVKNHPYELIRVYSKYVNDYCHQTKENRNIFYNQLLGEYNKAYAVNFNAKAAILFAFLINFSDKNIPLFDKDKNLQCQSNVFINPTVEGIKLTEFEKRTMHLTELFNSYKTNFSSGDFLSCIETAQKGDIVILDPPYPAQASKIYFKLKEERELYENLKATFKQLNENEVDFIVLYGSRIVALNNQFNDERDGVQHLVRLSTHPIFGHFLDHIYVSRGIPLTTEQLPKGMSFYNRLFKVNIENTVEEYDNAIAVLQTEKYEQLSSDQDFCAKL